MEQRLRVTCRRGEEVKYLSHLDLMRLWERALRRARLPLAYSEGFAPPPRISLAAPPAGGMTSQGGLMDVGLQQRISPRYFVLQLGSHLPQGVDVKEVQEVGLTAPSLQSLVRYAEYAVVVKAEGEEMEGSIARFLALSSLPWHPRREVEERHYDLRALVDEVWVLAREDAQATLGMRLRTDPSLGTGRPGQVTLARGLSSPPLSVHRLKLILARPSAPAPAPPSPRPPRQ